MATMISNLSEVQLEVPIIGINKDKDSVLLQPRGRVELPEGFEPADPKQRYLFVHPKPVATQQVAPVEPAPKK